MGRELTPVRRSLLARPQKLGFLPTLWFWNDWEAQRLLLPFVFMTAPFLLLINVLQMWLRLDAWVSISANFVVPFLTMGLVERYVRAQAQRRSVAGIANAPPRRQDVQAGVRAGRALMISLAVVSGALTVLLLLEVSPAVLGAAVIGGAALVTAVLRHRKPGPRLADSAARPASLPAPTSNGDHDAAGGDAARP